MIFSVFFTGYDDVLCVPAVGGGHQKRETEAEEGQKINSFQDTLHMPETLLFIGRILLSSVATFNDVTSAQTLL